jgi:hypothetical protein
VSILSQIRERCPSETIEVRLGLPACRRAAIGGETSEASQRPPRCQGRPVWNLMGESLALESFKPASELAALAFMWLLQRGHIVPQRPAI